MKIGFIGAGKVGTAFGLYLKKHGFHVEGYYSRTDKSAEKAACMTETKYYKDVQLLVGTVDVLFITTNDDEIPKVVGRLAQNNCLRPHQLIIHMSGAASSEILKDATPWGCHICSLHPLQAFVDIRKALDDLANTTFTIEGDNEGVSYLEKVLQRTGNQHFIIGKEQKVLYHAAACIVSNYLVTLLEEGLKLFEVMGIESDKAYGAIYPLIQGSIENIRDYGTVKALTGPIARGDVDTIKKHMAALNLVKVHGKEFYRFMGMKTLDLALKKDQNNYSKLEEIKKILMG